MFISGRYEAVIYYNLNINIYISVWLGEEMYAYCTLSHTTPCFPRKPITRWRVILRRSQVSSVISAMY